MSLPRSPRKLNTPSYPYSEALPSGSIFANGPLYDFFSRMGLGCIYPEIEEEHICTLSSICGSCQSWGTWSTKADFSKHICALTSTTLKIDTRPILRSLPALARYSPRPNKTKKQRKFLESSLIGGEKSLPPWGRVQGKGGKHPPVKEKHAPCKADAQVISYPMIARGVQLPPKTPIRRIQGNA